MKNVTKCKAYPIPQPSDPRSGHAHYAAGCLFRFCFCLRQNENCHIKHTHTHTPHTPHMPHAAPCCRSATWVIFIFNMKMHAKREQEGDSKRERERQSVGWLVCCAAPVSLGCIRVRQHCVCVSVARVKCGAACCMQHCNTALQHCGFQATHNLYLDTRTEIQPT